MREILDPEYNKIGAEEIERLYCFMNDIERIIPGERDFDLLMANVEEDFYLFRFFYRIKDPKQH